MGPMDQDQIQDEAFYILTMPSGKAWNHQFFPLLYIRLSYSVFVR